MKRLFLTSSVGTPGVAMKIRDAIGHNKPVITAFITTPVEPESEQEDLEWYEADRAALKDSSFDFFDYTLTGKKPSDLEKDLSDIEAIYVSGGNTNYLLYQSQQSGFISFIQDFVNQGKFYLGTSAGSIIAGPSLPEYFWDDTSSSPELHDFKCYGLVDFTIAPHWGSEDFREAYLGSRISEIYKKSLQPFIFLNNSQYVEVVDDWYRIVDVAGEM